MRIKLMGDLLNSTLMILCCVCCSGSNSQRSIPYPKPFPDTVALTFLPGIVSNAASDSLDFNAAFSPDGQSFYFTRPVKGKWQIFLSEYDGIHWAKPELALFNEQDYSQADPTFGPDGNLYFISNRPKNTSQAVSNFNIWSIKLLAGGKWSLPECVEAVNTDSTEYYISFAENGNLYFSSTREGGYGQEDIYVSKRINGRFSKPVNLGDAINSAESEHDPCISKDESFLVYNSYGRKEGYGQADLYASKMKKDRTWSRAANLGKAFNTPAYEYTAYITPDSKYFFFTSDYDIKWISADYLIHTIDRVCK